MKRLFLLLGLAAWVALIVLLPPKGHDDNSKASSSAPQSLKTARSNRTAPSKTDAVAQKEEDDAKPASLDERREDAHTIIDAAVVTYSPEGVKAIRPFLLDTDAEIRAAARDGMVQLGEADAVPLLRDAASKLKDTTEIASLQEAADLLALPAWSDTPEAAAVVADIRAGMEQEQ
ncbi:hypothetical protein [Haloferula sp. BvORR071]|uniref:hypothetical protein n=1 Tax=Haloferula sp. BvORR071 TaxID=1396141 RepID=UPI00054CEB6E|nr:hypothetical protein [Haloferula sp. BvORR071]